MHSDSAIDTSESIQPLELLRIGDSTRNFGSEYGGSSDYSDCNESLLFPTSPDASSGNMSFTYESDSSNMEMSD